MGTEHYGLQPDMGIFQHSPPRPMMEYTFRQAGNSPADAKQATDDLLARWRGVGREIDEDEFHAYARETYPAFTQQLFYTPLFFTMTAKPEELFDVAPYIFCFHGKFYGMEEIDGQPGEYDEPALANQDVITVLKAIGYDGYINSEFEGQRMAQDRGDEGLVDEVQQVRRHHQMLKRLIGA